MSICHNVLKKNGQIVAIFVPLNVAFKDGPPFEVSVDEICKLFSDKFNIITNIFSPYSVKARKDNEIFMELEKK